MRVLSVAWAAVLHCPPGWGDFYDSLAVAVDAFNEERYAEVVNETRDLLLPLAKKPPRALECPSAVASTFLLLGRASESLSRPRVGRAARQAALLFAASDAVELGTAYVDATPWPLTWREVSAVPPRAAPTLPRERNATGPGLRVAVVSVCAPGTGSFGRSSRANKEAYARRHGYGLEVFDEAPWLEDGLAAPSPEKAAWSKLDALLRVAAKGEYDWALWLDCDAFVANAARRVEDLRLPPVSDAEKAVVREMGTWSAGTGTGARRSLRDLLASNDAFLTEKMPPEKSRRSDKALTHRRLGWSGRLFHEPSPNIILSEDGLFPQTAAPRTDVAMELLGAPEGSRALVADARHRAAPVEGARPGVVALLLPGAHAGASRRPRPRNRLRSGRA
jgi:hypothetical protein